MEFKELTRESKIGDRVKWETVVGEKFEGELIEWDSNVAVVFVGRTGTGKAVEC